MKIDCNNEGELFPRGKRQNSVWCLEQNSMTTELLNKKSKPAMDTNSKLFLKSVYCSMCASAGVTTCFMPLYLQEMGFGPSIIGIVLFFQPIGGFLAGIVSPKILSRFSNEWRALMGFSILFLVCMFSMYFLPTATFSEVCLTQGIKRVDEFLSNASTHLRKMPMPIIASMNEGVMNITVTRSLFPKTENLISVNLTGEFNRGISREVPGINFDAPVQQNRHSFKHSQGNNNWWLFEPENRSAVIILVTIIVFSAEFCFVSLNANLQGITMRILGEGNSKQYGAFRSWGAIGHGAGSALTGVVITLTVREVIICGETIKRGEYHLMFYSFLCLGFLTCLNVKNIGNVVMGDRDNTVRKTPYGDLRHVFCTVRNKAWLFVVLCRSMFYAVTQGFVYWHMKNMGASPIMIGFATCVSTTTEFLVFFVTPRLIDVFGETKLVGAGIFSYICRFVLFSVIVNPIYILPVEILEGAVFACIWSSIMSYMSRQVGPEIQTQMAGIVQAVVMLGKSLGFLFSGGMIQFIGTRDMFLTFAGLASVVLVIFCVANAIYKPSFHSKYRNA